MVERRAVIAFQVIAVLIAAVALLYAFIYAVGWVRVGAAWTTNLIREFLSLEIWTLWGYVPWFGTVLLWAAIVSVAYAVIVEVWQRLTSKESRPAQTSAQPATERPHTWHWMPRVTVPYQHAVGIFGWLFGRGSLQKVRFQSCWKLPYFQIAELVNCSRVDMLIETEQIPAGVIQPPKGLDPSEAESADKARTKLAEERKFAISGTLAFVYRVTVSVRQDEAALRELFRAPSEYREPGSETVRQRLTNLLTAYIREVLNEMTFEDAYDLPDMVMLLGTTNERTGELNERGHERWVKILEHQDFRADLSNLAVLRDLVRRRPQSLLAAIYRLGYEITLFRQVDVNPPPALEKEMHERVLAEVRRDAAFTKHISDHRDKARAQRDARNIHAQASVFTYDTLLEAAAAAYERYHGTREGFLPSMQDLMQFQQFLEDRRTRRLMAEEGGNYTQIDISPEAPIPASFAPLYHSMGAPQNKKAGQSAKKDSSDK